MNQELKVPDHSVYMQTNRDFRLSSRNGYVVNFKANEPARVPPNAYEEAIGIGAVLCEDQPEQEPVVEKQVVHESVAEAAKLEAEAKIEYIQQACLKLMADNDSTAFKADGYPKYSKVIDILSPQAPKPSAAEIAQVWDDMRKNMELAEDY